MNLQETLIEERERWKELEETRHILTQGATIKYYSILYILFYYK
jgi:hypothetical protein